MKESELKLLQELGIKPKRDALFNPSGPVLSELSGRREEGVVVDQATVTGIDGTEPSERDRYIVKDTQTESRDWWEKSQETTPEIFSRLWDKTAGHLSRRDLFVLDLEVNGSSVPVRFITEFAWRALLARQKFESPETPADGGAPWTVMDAPSLKAFPLADGTNSEAFIAVDVSGRRVLIIGTASPAEIEGAIQTALKHQD